MKPRVLILYYSFTAQTRRVAEAMATSFERQGCDVAMRAIEFVDDRYRIELPFRPVGRQLARWLWPQLVGKTGRVRVCQETLAGDYDLVCLGSPTWWLNPAMPIVSFLKSPAAHQLLDGKRFAVFAVCRKAWWNNARQVRRLATKQGGRFVGGAAFCFAGGEIQSALSFVSYMNHDADLERYCGVKIHKFGVADEGIARAEAFAAKLAENL